MDDRKVTVSVGAGGGAGDSDCLWQSRSAVNQGNNDVHDNRNQQIQAQQNQSH